MFIDMHMHEMTYSKDSFLKLHEIVEIARKKGLDGVCITDHDSMGLKEYASSYSKKVNLPIFVGMEYYSLQGDIVAFGIEDYPKERIDAQDFIHLVKRQGGICFAAHPFRNNNRGLGEHLRDVEGLDGIEVLNGSTSQKACEKAAAYARELGLAQVGASDCHVREKVGIYAAYFPEKVNTIEELLAAFQKGSVRPAFYDGNQYQIWNEKNTTISLPFDHSMIEYIYKCQMRAKQEGGNNYDYSKCDGR